MDGSDVGARTPEVSFEVGRSENRWKDLVLGLALLLAVFAVYYPVHHYPFVDIDDGLYVYANAHVTSPINWASIQWAFSHYYNDNYVPLDFISHSLDVQAFRLHAGSHHDVNVLLHALNAVLLFWVLLRATGFRWRSLMVAALFALHPMNVENVAWIAERKTILSTLFFLLALAVYRRYVCHPKQRGMALVAILFTLGLLAKPQVIMLPFVLLLWDYWPLRRMLPWGRHSGEVPEVGQLAPRKLSALLEEKFPLFAIAFADALLTMHAEKGMEDWKYPLYIRLGNAILSYGHYIEKAFWPNHLALMYLHPGYGLPWWHVLMSLMFLVGVSALVVVKRNHPYLVVGWLWFLGTLLPTIGLVQISVFAMADRYVYISLIGLFIMICWGVGELAEQRHCPRIILLSASLAVLVALSFTTRHQVGYWRDRFTLWTHTLVVTQTNWVAEARLGDYYSAQGQKEEALTYFYRAADDRSSEIGISFKIALIEHQRRNLKQALVYYQKVLAVSKDQEMNARALANMGHAYSDLGDIANAQRCYREAQRLSASASGPSPD